MTVDPTVVHVEGRSIALFRANGELHAYVNACPHRGGPIGEGPVVDGVVMCPWHGWKFDVTTGARIGRAQDVLQRVPARVDGDHVLVAVDRAPLSPCI